MLTLYKLFVDAVRKYVDQLGKLNAQTADLLQTMRDHLNVRIQHTDEIMKMVDRLRAMRGAAERAQEEVVDEVMNNDMPMVIVSSDSDSDDDKN